ncbi:hypothetical protein PCCS19_30060 [Paenibacillus sp. CCS19]|uniref:non-ribosomal peptide synthetase n=1 Tax=Paenibacillus sp. CCS19 TaxID=3158387 RepID=UPI00256A1E97|nr:non-ribosomal peptide synthetase [Paenibacillus cellulosilyticus]GMK39951.1 hypothetical protein PCCS19_30060 [Paenibacillus cellulosilyticus]
MMSDWIDLSSNQQRIYTLAQQSNNCSFVSRCVIRLQARPNADRLAASISSVLSLYAVGTGHSFEIMKAPLSHLKQEAIFSASEQDRLDPRAPVLRSRLMIAEPDKWYLALEISSLYADKLGLRVLAKAIIEQYAGDCPSEVEIANRPTYAMVAEWKNTLCSDVEGMHARAFWRNLMDDCEQSLSSAAAGESFISEAIELPLPISTWQSMDKLCRANGWSSQSFIWSCWQSLIWRARGRYEEHSGLVVSGRNYAELLSIVGPLSACVPTKKYDLQSLRFNHLVSQLEADLSEFEQFQEYFSYDKFYESTAYIPIQFEYAQDVDPQWEQTYNVMIVSEQELSDRFELKLEYIDSMHRPVIRLHYNSGNLSLGSAQSYISCLQTLIIHAIANPNQPIEELEWLDDEEKQRILKDFNPSESPIVGLYAHEWFEQAAAEMPDHVAIMFGEEEITYRELNQMANRLAHCLRAKGVTTDTLVGIYMERTPELIIGILGVLKAGGAYLPLETQYPPERLAYMLEDSACPIVLTSSSASLNPPAGNHEIVRVDVTQLQDGPHDNLKILIDDKDLAYVIYTSGSTGRPKGVMIEHHGLRNYLSWCSLAYRSKHRNRSPVHSSIGFDLTVTSLFTPLISGDALHLVVGDDPLSIVDELARLSGLGLVKITPAHLEILSRMLPGDKAANWAETIVVGGEQLYGDNLSFWREYAPNTVIVNEYGPTETVVGCSVASFSAEDRQTGPLTIGRPIPNMRIHILDSKLRPVPVGVVGELYIGGVGVARGYLNREDLTRERFIADPYGPPGSRLYRTGDLGSYRQDGQLDYHGRMDDQVKIRGYRIELQEIEAVVVAFPGIRECAVFVDESNGGDKSLKACFVPVHHPYAQLNDLLAYLHANLPGYMVPIQWVSLPRLPLTINGKVDRSKLVQLAREHQAAEVMPAEERTLTEEALVSLYRNLLGKEAISITQSFFELGGNSIQAIQCVSRIQSMFGVEFPLRDFFDYPTIRQLSSHLDQLLEQQLASELEGLSEEEVLALLKEAEDSPIR